SVLSGLVQSLNRPGGNVTGVGFMTAELAAKRLGLLHDLLPGAARLGVLVNPKGPAAIIDSTITDLHTAGSVIGRQIDVVHASTNREIETAFESLVQRRADALVVTPDAFFNARRV